MRAVIGDVKKMSELSDSNLIEDLEKNIRRAKDQRGVRRREIFGNRCSAQ